MPPPEPKKIARPAAPAPPPAPRPGKLVKPAAPKPVPAPKPLPTPVVAGPFTTCLADATEIPKLPKQTTEIAWPKERATTTRLTEDALAAFNDAPQPSR